MTSALDEQEEWQVAYTYSHRDGRKIPVIVSVKNIPDLPVEGRRDGVSVVLVIDISEQKKIEVELETREQELRAIRRKFKYETTRSKMIGHSKAMHQVFDVLLRCADVASSVLILGETGVGKEMAARAIHENSVRKDKPFVAVNCGALPETLLESELFGYVKGAFTGASSDRPGLFREANGGTLFLDEVGDLKQPLQVKLLRALQEGEIRPLGDSRSYPVDTRIIAATNQDLEEQVSQKRFRQDLYYRLSVIPLTIPPLRNRTEDILPLAEYFLRKHRKPSRSEGNSLGRAAKELLLHYPWPGNIRELENAVEYALAMASDPEILPEDFPAQIARAPRSEAVPAAPPGIEDRVSERAPLIEKTLRALKTENLAEEKDKIFEALRLHRGNQTLAAKELGISRVTLWRKIKKYELI
jgi:transcriptional regulator with PAS, ATPase and Fis domain